MFSFQDQLGPLQRKATAQASISSIIGKTRSSATAKQPDIVLNELTAPFLRFKFKRVRAGVGFPQEVNPKFETD
jgi:hypothetical protein